MTLAHNAEEKKKSWDALSLSLSQGSLLPPTNIPFHRFKKNVCLETPGRWKNLKHTLALFRYWGVVSEPPELPRSELMDENGGRCSQAAHTLLHYRDHIPKCWKNFSRQTHPEFPRRFITQKWGVARDSLRVENWIVMCSSFRTLTRPCL